MDGFKNFDENTVTILLFSQQVGTFIEMTLSQVTFIVSAWIMKRVLS